jgi:predicted RNase H-like HicB family nuclease
MTQYMLRCWRQDGVDADSDFGVDFPDFPGCVTAGTTLDEPLRMAQEALEFHIGGMVEDGEELPARAR